MINKLCFFILIFASAFTSSKVIAEETSLNSCTPNDFSAICEQIIENRAYLKPDVILVSSTEIFLHTNDRFIRINNLYSDSLGIYLNLEEINPKVWTDACPNGHTNLCGLCGGCLKLCRYRCQCSPFR